ncbi:Leucine zipper putative tumor suppressor 2-like protein, partial [Armadillidium vulgare]
GKVVIRPIAFKPVVPNGVGHPPSGSKGVVTGGGQEGSIENGHSTFVTLQGRPDPRYTSTPTLSRGPIQHYGSMGDLKSLGHSSSYSLDRRGGVVPNTRNYYDPYVEANNNVNNNNNNNSNINNLNKYSPSTKMNGKYTHGKTINSQQSDISNSPLSQHSSNPTSPNSSSNGSSSLSVGHSPPSYPMPPPRPPSHQSSCSNAEDGQPHSHHRYPSYESRLSSTYDAIPSFEHGPPSHTTSTYSSPHKYHSSAANTTDLPRYESLRNLSSTESHTHIGHPRLTHTHHRMGGSVSNLTRLGHHHHLHHHHSGSISGSNLGLDRSLSVTGSNLGLDRSVTGSIRGSLSELRLDDHHQTPSPSDSGVAELEAMLKEKDSEINNLRETMEQNEQVIFKVYEEKEKTWERELKKIRDIYDSRLKAAQQKASQSGTESKYANLSAYVVKLFVVILNYITFLFISKLQQERRKVSAELEEVKRERDTGNKQVEQLKKEVGSLRTQLEETEWGLCQKSGEISLLKTQLKDSQGDQTTRGHELLHLRAQVRQYQQEVERRRAEISSMHDLTTQLRRETADLRSQLEKAQQTQNSDQDMAQMLEKTRKDVEKQRNIFEEERSRWVEEKERVIRYQKQLHHNYVSMLSRNRQLEEEVARLTGVPLPPVSSHNVSCAIPPNLPNFTSSCLPSVPGLPQTYSELREGALTINSESRC